MRVESCRNNLVLQGHLSIFCLAMRLINVVSCVASGQRGADCVSRNMRDVLLSPVYNWSHLPVAVMFKTLQKAVSYCIVNVADLLLAKSDLTKRPQCKKCCLLQEIIWLTRCSSYANLRGRLSKQQVWELSAWSERCEWLASRLR